MPVRLILRAFALTVLSLSLASVASAKPRNLLSNPGFEDPLVMTLRTPEGRDTTLEHPWMPAAWDTSRAGLPSVFFGRDTFLVHTGVFAASVANVSSLFPMGHNWSQRVVVGKEAWGKDLVFSVWTRSNGLDGRAYILLQAYRDTITKMAIQWNIDRDQAARRLGINKVDDPLLDLGWKRQYFIEQETPWVRREVRVYCPPSVNVVWLRVGMTGTGQVILDDASLTLEKAQPAHAPKTGENLLVDSGFEGDGTQWEYSMPPYEGMRIDRDSTIMHSGRASIRYESGMGEYVQTRTGVCQALPNRALAGKRIRLTAWVKTDSLRGTAYTKLYCHTVRGVFQVPQAEQFGLNTDWTLTTLEMDVPKDCYQVWAWFCYDAPRPGTVRYDDTKLEVLGPATGVGGYSPQN